MYNDAGKNKNDQTQRKGSNVHKKQKQQVAKQSQINNRTETTNGSKQRKQAFKHKHRKQHIQKNRKTKKTQTNTHTQNRKKQHQKHTHTESQKLRAKRALTHTQEATTNQDYLFRNCTKTTAN